MIRNTTVPVCPTGEIIDHHRYTVTQEQYQTATQSAEETQ